MRQRVSKDTFLLIYHLARVRAFTKGTVLSAFRATGVYPLDRDILTLRHIPAAMVTQKRINFDLPLPTPACALLKRHRQPAIPSALTLADAVRLGDAVDSHSSGPEPESPLAIRAQNRATGPLATALQGTSAEFLVSDSPLKSTARLPAPLLQSIPKSLEPDWSLLQSLGNVAKMSRNALELEVENLRGALHQARGALKAVRGVYEGAGMQLVL